VPSAWDRGKASIRLICLTLGGRVLPTHQVIFGCGLVHAGNDHQLAAINVRHGETALMIAHLEARVRALHPALASIRFTQEWGGPILFPESGRPFYCRRPRSPRALVVGTADMGLPYQFI